MPHAQPHTQGFGFSLTSALGVDDATAIDDDGTDDTGKKRVRYREMSIDTVLGFWMPDTYARELAASVETAERTREERLDRIGRILRTRTGQTTALAELGEHVSSLRELLETSGIDAHPIPNHISAFKSFLESRTRMLGDADARRRHARIMTLAPMPDIWQDSGAVAHFAESFFEDLAYRAGQFAGNKGRVIRSLSEGIYNRGRGQPDTDDDWKDAMKSGLATAPWSEDEWVR